ncbi:MAG: peptidase C39 [Planctomycetota bacterium]
MVDLILASLGMSFLCGLTGWGARRLLHKRSGLASPLLCLAVILAAGCVYFTNGWLSWARFVPLTAAIVWTNLAPVFLSVAAAAAIVIPERPAWRRCLLSLVLIGFAVGTLLQPIMQPFLRPVRRHPSTVWLDNEVCQQSSRVTCSPAAAATLLRAAEIHVEEHQLIDWCLTDSLGTTSLGLWRGLKKATSDTPWRPEVIDITLDELLSRDREAEIFPRLILVGFPRFGSVASPEVEARYTEEYGWPRGFRHSVVLFGPSDGGGVDVGDPSIGRERWAEQDLRILWRGEAVRLVRSES